MDVKEARRLSLERLVALEPGPERGRKGRFAARIGKAPAQVSQWLSGYRSIEDDSAREIERRLRLPRWTMDSEDLPAIQGQPPDLPSPGLEQALEVLGMTLALDLPDDVRQDAADLLAKLAHRRGAERHQRELVELLQGEGAASKRRAA